MTFYQPKMPLKRGFSGRRRFQLFFLGVTAGAKNVFLPENHAKDGFPNPSDYPLSKALAEPVARARGGERRSQSGNPTA